MINDDAGDDADYFVCHNHLYSPEALLSSAGSITERYDYDAYGLPVICTATASGGGDPPLADWWDSDETPANAVASGQEQLQACYQPYYKYQMKRFLAILSDLARKHKPTRPERIPL